MNPEQRESRERDVEPCAHQLVDRSHGERPDTEALDPLVAERARKLVRFCVLGCDADSGQNAHLFVVESPARELQGPRRGPVEPLHVVDGKQHRSARGDQAEAAAECGANRPFVGRRPVRLREQERHLEGAPLG